MGLPKKGVPTPLQLHSNTEKWWSSLRLWGILPVFSNKAPEVKSTRRAGTTGTTRDLARVNQGRLSEPAIQTAGHKKSVITLDISWSISWDWIRCGCLMMIINFFGWYPFFFTCFLELWGLFPFSNIWWIAMVGSFLGTSSYNFPDGSWSVWHDVCIFCPPKAQAPQNFLRISGPSAPFIFFQSPFKNNLTCLKLRLDPTAISWHKWYPLMSNKNSGNIPARITQDRGGQEGPHRSLLDPQPSLLPPAGAACQTGPMKPAKVESNLALDQYPLVN